MKLMYLLNLFLSANIFAGLISTIQQFLKITELNEIFRVCNGDEKIILLNMIENINDENIYKIYIRYIKLNGMNIIS